MSFPKFNELDELTTINKIEDEIFLMEKNLFDLRMKRATNQKLKPHLFKHAKRRIKQLHFKKSLLLKK
jgi:large subunit ribosomal protein L29